MIKVRITGSHDTFKHLFDDQALEPGQSFELAGNAQCRFLSGNQKGIDAISVIIFVLENIEALSSGLLSAWLYEKLKREKIDTIEIDGKAVPVEKKALEHALEQHKSASPESDEKGDPG